MVFGNWEVDKQGIVGLGRLSKYHIASNELNLMINGNLYDKLINTSEKADVTGQDIYDLNDAYRYALEKFKIENIHNISFEDNIAMQIKIISEKTGDTESESSFPFDTDNL